MLRVEVDDSPDTLTLKLQGRLVGEEAKNTGMLLTRRRAGMRLIVDLTEVTFVDAVGEDVLSLFGELGADFLAETSYSHYICERLQLRLAPDGKLDAKPGGAPHKNRRGTKLHTVNREQA